MAGADIDDNRIFTKLRSFNVDLWRPARLQCMKRLLALVKSNTRDLIAGPFDDFGKVEPRFALERYGRAIAAAAPASTMCGDVHAVMRRENAPVAVE